MTNKFIQISDFYARLYLKKNSFNNKLKTVIKTDCLIPKNVSFFSKKKENSTLIKNRCVLTGRSRAVSRQFRISRMPLKYLMLHGFIPGISKTSW